MSNFTIICSRCQAEKPAKPTKDGKGVKLPRGWKRFDGQPRCLDCWRSQYSRRSVSLPIAECLSHPWKEFMTALHAGWSLTTQAANWTVREMALRDRRLPDQAKIERWKPPYLYPMVRAMYPLLAPSSVVELLNSVQRTYGRRRFETTWTSEASVASFRYPVPYPLHNQSWYVDVDAEREGALVLSMRLGSGLYRLRLRGGMGFREKRGVILAAMRTDELRGALSIARQRVSQDHHQGDTVNGAGGKQRVRYRIVARMALWVPLQKRKDAKGVLTVRTASDRLLVALAPGREEPFFLNADHIRTVSVGHERFLKRMAEDMKFEKRWPKRMREGMLARLDRACLAQRRRLDSFVKQTAAALVGFARRQRLATVRYEDSERSYFQSFPWAALRDRIAVKCAECHIEFSSGNVVAKSAEVLDVTE